MTYGSYSIIKFKPRKWIDHPGWPYFKIGTNLDWLNAIPGGFGYLVWSGHAANCEPVGFCFIGFKATSGLNERTSLLENCCEWINFQGTINRLFSLFLHHELLKSKLVLTIVEWTHPRHRLSISFIEWKYNKLLKP